LTNTKGKTDEKILSVYYDDLYRQSFSSLYLLVNIDRKIPSIYTERITMGNKE
jgi:hypothetical protein